MRLLEQSLRDLRLPGHDLVFDLDFTSIGTLPRRGCPIFTQSRAIGNRWGILWPLPPFHALDSPWFGALVSRLDRPWDRKIPELVWRGKDTGRGLNTIKKLETEELVAGPFRQRFNARGDTHLKANRYQLAWDFAGRAGFNVAFNKLVNANDEQSKALTAAGAVAESLSQSAILRYKYLLVIEGNDTASQLPWALASNSVVVMPPPCWENFFMDGIEPWVHYVPIRTDFSDLVQIREWLIDNDGEAQRISRNATAHMQQFYDPADFHAILQGVIDDYAGRLVLPGADQA